MPTQGGTLARLTLLQELYISVIAAITAWELQLAGILPSLQVLDVVSKTELPQHSVKLTSAPRHGLSAS